MKFKDKKGYEATAYLISNIFTGIEIQTLGFKDIVNRVYPLPRYCGLPGDVQDEIAMLCEKSEVPKGKNKLDVVLAYFEHALTCRVVKKYDFTNKELQLLISSVHFLDIFLENPDKKYNDVIKLHSILTRLATRHHSELEKQLTYAFKEFTRVTNQQDVLCNHLVLASITACFFAKSANIDKKLKDKIFKLANKIHDKIEKTEGDTEMYQNSAKICGDFYKHIERLKYKKR